MEALLVLVGNGFGKEENEAFELEGVRMNDQNVPMSQLNVVQDIFISQMCCIIHIHFLIISALMPC